MDVSAQFPEAPDPAAFVYHGEGIVANVSGSLVGVTTSHHGHTPIIMIMDESSATGVWAMEDNLFMPDCSSITGYGHYHERYRRDGDVWRISETRLTRLKVIFVPAS